jgi:glyoxylate reductase
VLTDRVTRELLEGAPRLRVVGNCAVGVDNVDVAAATALGIQVCNTPNVLTEATADLAWALLMAAARRVVEADRLVRSGAFQRWELGLLLGKTVHGSTLGILGCGRIGKAVARRARGFDMRVLYAQRHRLPEAEESVLGVEHVDLGPLLERSDFVSVHLPLTPETRHLLDAAALARVKPGAVLVNTARGAIIDEGALVAALDEGRLAGAGLDVFEHEPAVHPGLLASSRVVLAPHIGSATAATRIAMAESVATDVLRVLEGGAPQSGVNS